MGRVRPRASNGRAALRRRRGRTVGSGHRQRPADRGLRTPAHQPLRPSLEAFSPMTIVLRPSRVVSLLGGSIAPRANPCTHAAPRLVSPWTGEPGTAGRAVVLGAGKMGLPLPG